MSESSGLAWLRWSGGARDSAEFDALVDDSRRCLLHAGDPDQGLSAVADIRDMLACLLDALEQLRTLGTAYGVRWQREARLRGATTAAQYARPLADRAGDGPWDLELAAGAGRVLSALSDAVENMDAATQPFADDPDRTDADEALTGSVHDSLLHVFRDAERRQRFGRAGQRRSRQAVLQGRPDLNKALHYRRPTPARYDTTNSRLTVHDSRPLGAPVSRMARVSGSARPSYAAGACSSSSSSASM